MKYVFLFQFKFSFFYFFLNTFSSFLFFGEKNDDVADVSFSLEEVQYIMVNNLWAIFIIFPMEKRNYLKDSFCCIMFFLLSFFFWLETHSVCVVQCCAFHERAFPMDFQFIIYHFMWIVHGFFFSLSSVLMLSFLECIYVSLFMFSVYSPFYLFPVYFLCFLNASIWFLQNNEHITTFFLPLLRSKEEKTEFLLFLHFSSVLLSLHFVVWR